MGSGGGSGSLPKCRGERRLPWKEAPGDDAASKGILTYGFDLERITISNGDFMETQMHAGYSMAMADAVGRRRLG